MAFFDDLFSKPKKKKAKKIVICEHDTELEQYECGNCNGLGWYEIEYVVEEK